MRTALSTSLRAPRSAAPEIVARLGRLGATAIAIDATLPEELADALGGLPVVAVAWRGRARLCAPEADERRAAIASAQRAVRRAGASGAGLCAIALGAADVRWDEVEMARRLARDEWSPARVLDERRAVAARHVDAARFALERLIPLAEREAARIAIATRASLIDLPDAGEAAALLADFRGAPIGYWHDTAAAYREELLGAGEAAAWLALSPLGATAADACGMGLRLAPGLGEVDFAPLEKVGIVVIEGEGSEEEIRAARARFGSGP